MLNTRAGPLILWRGFSRQSLPRSRSYATESQAIPKSSGSFRSVGILFATTGIASAAYVAGSLYPPTLVTLLYPTPAPPSPSASSPEEIQQTQQIESQIQSLPQVKALRNQPDKYYETRPFANFPEDRRIHSLTAGTLRGPGKLAVPPILFATHDDSETVAFIHVGRSLCGHDGIIHGGLLATIIDEAFGRTSILNLPNKIGVTANLSVNYRAPTRADQFLKVTTKLVEVKGRKAIVSGRIEDLSGTVLIEAHATYVEPKYAKLLSSSAVLSAIGKRENEKGVTVPQEASI